MKWWELYDPARRIPGYVPPPSDAATERAGTAGMLWLAGVVALIASVVVAFMFREWTSALWIMGGSFVLLGVSAWLLPKDKRGR